uniref:Uncharacterized protein n=1 Tax=Arundo donax TaxID=35708 RepID=A0A0A8Y5N6_ARUDO
MCFTILKVCPILCSSNVLVPRFKNKFLEGTENKLLDYDHY